jgi:intracellular multiplication protein IcmQ
MDNEQRKHQLLQLVKAERTAFKKTLDAYYQKSNPTKEEYLLLNKKLILSLGRVFAFYDKHQCDESLFLRNTLKPLREALDQANTVREELTGQDNVSEQELTELSLKDNEVLVYITLYQAGGSELSRWEMQLRSLASVLQSRPIYEQEEDVAKVVRKSMTLNSQGYVSVAVDKDAIIRSDGDDPRCDQYGSELLMINEGSIRGDEAIKMFVLGERHYRYQGGKLVAVDAEKSRFFG